MRSLPSSHPVLADRVRRHYRPSAAAFAVGALLGTVLLGGGPVWAHFTASAQAAGQTTSRSVAVTQAGFDSLNQTYRNTHSTLTQTGSFTITNTGKANGQVSVSISGSGSFLSNLPIRVWPVASTGECTAATTVPKNAASGTWGSATVASDTTLRAGARVVYCVRTTIDPHTQRPQIATTSGTQSAQSRLTATLSASGWSAKATATNTHKTEGIYPPATAYLPSSQSRWYTIRSGSNADVCLDATGDDGSRLISWGCHDGPNQRWRIQPDNYYQGGKEDQTLVTLRPRNLPFDRVASARNGVALLGLNNDSDDHFRWYVQKMTSNRYMLISHFDGTCLSVRSSPRDAAHATVECTDPTAILDLRREGLSFQSDGWAEWFDAQKEEEIKPTGTLFFGSPAGSRFIMQYQDRTGKWIDIATTDPESDRIQIGGPKISHQTKIRFINPGSNKEVVWDGLTAYFQIENDPTPSENNYRYKLSLSIKD